MSTAVNPITDFFGNLGQAVNSGANLYHQLDPSNDPGPVAASGGAPATQSTSSGLGLGNNQTMLIVGAVALVLVIVLMK